MFMPIRVHARLSINCVVNLSSSSRDPLQPHMLSPILRSLRPRIIKPSIFSASFATSPFDIRGAATIILSPLHASIFTSIDRPVPPMPHSPVIVKVQGSDGESVSDHESHLLNQLQSVPQGTKYLRLDEDTPSDKEWALLGAHFSKVENLELESGFNEELNDKHIPSHWPLQRLELRSTCGELVQSPFVLQGRVSHLSLLLTCGLRFTGPTTDELLRLHKEEVERGETQAEYITRNEGTPEEKRVEVIHVPDMVCRHMNKFYADSDTNPNPNPESELPSNPINLRTLEIFENDSIDTFCRMTMALPNLVNNLQTLRIRSTKGLDFCYLDEGSFRYILPQLENLKTLNLTVGDVFQDPTYLPTLHKVLPPNLTTLFFRGPASLCQSEHWSDWLRAFESKDFLPQLQRLAFVLDLHCEKKKSRTRVVPAPAGLLYQARVACEHLYGIVRRRGVRVESMPPEPEAENNLFKPVDDRW